MIVIFLMSDLCYVLILYDFVTVTHQ
jgi:hypothetical protein